MSILVGQETRALVQGITGKEGTRAAEDMLAYGTAVVAGVTPGKGGQVTEAGVPVYDSVAEARAAHPEINLSLIAVPGKFVGAAAEESIRAGIPLINILSERVPVYDVAKSLALARQCGVTIVGPSSVGIISPDKGKVGSIGLAGLAKRFFMRGPVGVISKSGGMTSEIARVLTEAGIGQSTALGIGGDEIIGMDILDCARLMERDPETRAIALFGEVGGSYEDLLASAMRAGEITKPVVALIAGVFGDALPAGTVLGHAGAIVEKGRGAAPEKIQNLREAGAHIAETPEEIVAILQTLL